MIQRRLFLGGLAGILAGGAAPVIVRPASLMPVRSLLAPAVCEIDCAVWTFWTGAGERRVMLPPLSYNRAFEDWLAAGRLHPDGLGGLLR